MSEPRLAFVVDDWAAAPDDSGPVLLSRDDAVIPAKAVREFQEKFEAAPGLSSLPATGPSQCEMWLNGIRCQRLAAVLILSGCEREHIHENLLCGPCRDKVAGNLRNTCLQCGAPEQIERISPLEPGLVG
jgi:hypothetical protein